MRRKSKNSIRHAKKRKIQEAGPQLEKEPDPSDLDFYLDDIDKHHLKRTKIDVVEDDNQYETDEEEIMPLPDVDDADSSEESQDSMDEEEDNDLNHKKLLDIKEKNKQMSSDDDDEEEGVPNSNAWGPKKHIYFHNSLDSQLISRFLKMSKEDQEVFAKPQKTYWSLSNWKRRLIPIKLQRVLNIVDEDEVAQQKQAATTTKPELVPTGKLPTASTSLPADKTNTVKEVLEMLKDKLDFDHKNIYDNLSCVIYNLPKGCTTLKSWDIFPHLQKKMEEHKASKKVKNANQIEAADLNLVPVEPTEDKEQMVEEEMDDTEDQQQQQLEETEESQELGPIPLPYEIAKNVGIKIYRKKEYRNPRVRNKNKYRKALIKRKSRIPQMRTVPSNYTGEKFGINTQLIRSRKFNY